MNKRGENMKYVINGIFLTQKITGVQRYGIELLKALDNIEYALDIDVLIPEYENTNIAFKRLKVIKYGAYESYLIRNHQIDVLHSHSLPVGMASTMKMVSYDMKIKENDILILTSDGVGEHFFDLLKKYQEEIEKMSVYEIVSFLFQKSFQKKDLDDMSIIVIKVVNRN